MDYKKYSLENLEKWMSDALLSSEATPQEIYDVIRKVVEEEYYYFKYHTGRCYDLLALLNGHSNDIMEQVKAQGEVWDKEDTKLTCDKDDKSPECQKAWNDFWEENYYPEEHQKHNEEVKDDGMRPWGHSDLEYLIANPTLTKDRISNFPGEQYDENTLNEMCDKAASEEEKDKCREYNLREAEYYNQRAELDAQWKPVSVPSQPLYVSEDGDVWIPDAVTKEDRVVKWQLPVEVDGISGEYYVQFPDDLMEAADIKEDDMVEWVDQGDGSYLLKKVNVHS